ncbi:MAG: bifunctional 5,10-methylenetetrahydrofolate dehydrogenase/5,10-methenyltetrahydrofolate cyclohydrolase [SAR202 cluster bacterium]|nr:bifunctional 5,10-methylenetetrahydrofolate dehydrogenase/5,10-methenyltetrahydrofolate cyclohydrolase [SAR202 cluster bacterium]|tara:strand:+ start:4458 stop:5345 length:888 start_codon:yes stop_codon:yes gene_type:complete
MVAAIIDGKIMSAEIRLEIANRTADFTKTHQTRPGLAAVLVGNDPASAVYVRNKRRACDEAGMFSETFTLPETASQDELIELVEKLNVDIRFHGILVQLPLPSHIDEREVIMTISPSKDVDGLHPISSGLLMEGNPRFVPATPAGVQQMLIRSGNDPDGKHTVILGRSNIVGKPLACLLLQKNIGANSTVTVCHTGTKNTKDLTLQADIVIAAVGKPLSLTSDMIQDGAVVIDVGINRIEDSSRKTGYRLVGDVDYDNVSLKASAITPVPGGVGPMTIAMLLDNTLKAAQYMVAI